MRETFRYLVSKGNCHAAPPTPSSELLPVPRLPPAPSGSRVVSRVWPPGRAVHEAAAQRSQRAHPRSPQTRAGTATGRTRAAAWRNESYIDARLESLDWTGRDREDCSATTAPWCCLKLFLATPSGITAHLVGTMVGALHRGWAISNGWRWRLRRAARGQPRRGGRLEKCTLYMP